MGKFKVEMKLQGLELKVEGDRQDIPLITQNLTQQVAGLFEPAANIAGETTPRKTVANEAAIVVEPKASGASKRKGKGNSNAKASGEPPLDWKHDPTKWGTPKQAWNPTKKAIWLLYVAKNECDATQMSAGLIASTFNKHFKEAGKIRGSNVSRDLAKAKALTPSLVGQDTSAAGEFFLVDAGSRLAGKLAAEARGETIEPAIFDGAS